MPNGSDLIDAARKFRGVPYEYGGKTATGLDCSGLVALAAREVGVMLPHGTAAQIAACTPITLDVARRTPGALLWREGHDGLSAGSGVIEAREPVVVEGAWSDTYDGGKTRWTRAGLLPGITYPEATMTQKIISPARGRLTSGYGPRPPLPRHYGMDIASLVRGTPNQPVYAIAAGRVTKIARGRAEGAGIGQVSNGVPALSAIMSGDGVEVVFDQPIHVDGVTVIGQRAGHVYPPDDLKVGDRVPAGRYLGSTNLSGGTSNYHAHIELMTGRGPYDVTDPVKVLTALDITPGSDPDLSTTTNTPDQSEEDFLMALSETQQRQIYEALVVGGPSQNAYYMPEAIVNVLRKEIAPAIAAIQAGSILFPGAGYAAFPALVNAVREGKDEPIAVDVDEEAIAKSLAPLIAANAGALSDEDVKRFAKTFADELAKRIAS